MGEESTPSVLVVDDDREVREVLKDLLRVEGFPVTTAAGGLSALLRIGSDRPECVVLDLRLQDVSGFDICRALRADPDFCRTPVLIISGAYADADWVRRQVGMGPLHYLSKPIVQQDLIHAIRSLVSQGTPAPAIGPAPEPPHQA